MNACADLLRRTRERLDLPPQTKARILLEIAADLEGLYSAYRAQGATHEEAEQRAVATCDLSETALAELIDVHRSWYAKLMDHLSERGQARWERGMLALLLVFIAATAGAQIAREPLLADAGPWAWPLVGIALAAAGLGLQQAHKLWVRQDHRPQGLRAPLLGLFGLAGGDLLIGLGGVAHGLMAGVAGALAGPDASAWRAVPALRECAALVTVCLLVFILVALIGFLLLRRVARIEQAELATRIAWP